MQCNTFSQVHTVDLCQYQFFQSQSAAVLQLPLCWHENNPRCIPYSWVNWTLLLWTSLMRPPVNQPICRTTWVYEYLYFNDTAGSNKCVCVTAVSFILSQCSGVKPVLVPIIFHSTKSSPYYHQASHTIKHTLWRTQKHTLIIPQIRHFNIWAINSAWVNKPF